MVPEAKTATARADEPEYTALEEALHAGSHGVGAVLSVFALAAMLHAASANGFMPILAAGAYGTGMLLMFGSSAAYHSFSRTAWSRHLEMFDHIAIFLMIAGTYTPISLVALPTSIGRNVAIAVWTIAASGTLFKLVTFAVGLDERLRTISLLLYLAMGWMGIWIFDALLASLPTGALLWLLAGGVAYTLGAVIYGVCRFPYAHFIWHLAVLGGAACHFVAIQWYVLG